jgi:inhibitor of cysteine peptidase
VFETIAGYEPRVTERRGEEKTMRRILGTMLVLMVLGLAACKPGAIEVGEAEAGSTVSLTAGQELRVTLPGNPTTGFNWTVASADAGVLALAGEPSFKPDSAAIGAGGTITLTFKAVAAGDTELALKYSRSWETSVPPAKTYSLKVVVE